MNPTTEFTNYTPKRVLAVGAHADDIDYGASGSVATWAAAGAHVEYLVITDGSSGSEDTSISTDELIAVRETEQKNAAKVLGAKDVHFLHYRDGQLENTMALKKDIVRVIRQVKPDTVVVFDPTFIYSSELGFINHPDHRAAGQATLDAIFPLARDHLSFPELYNEEKLAPHKVAHALLINMEKANFFVDISDHLETKLAGLFEHVSQVGEQDQTRDMITQRATAAGLEAGVSYAESFVRIDPPQ